ncbi:type IV pilus modification protein PilV [Kangiella spongicola]|uniref:Type IV pilus modification protein PilV n=1 Tax=Kangiella spongicola TaxID=796379 RepID=A0A318D713_9GAMM|nr:type IV pilus modification protein PilV [Kangiella spongicola]PXF62974.1 type IV pilus modification protein PilV [Kangiella spongicola]
MIQRKISGISLIEVLITVLVMAVGMLGVAALQVKALNTSQESYSKSQAVVVLEGMADLMRADYEFIHSDEVGNNTYSAQGDNWCAAPPAECTKSSCSKVEQAQTNMAQACTALAATGIPGAKMGAKCLDLDGGVDTDACTPGSLHLLYVSWQPTVRDDTDGEDTYSGPMTRCHNEFSLNANEDCVFIELVP